MQSNARCKELVSYSVLSSSHVSVISVFLLTQTNKRQAAHLANSVYRKRRRKNFRFCSVRCIYRPALKQRDAQQQNNHNNNNGHFNGAWFLAKSKERGSYPVWCKFHDIWFLVHVTVNIFIFDFRPLQAKLHCPQNRQENAVTWCILVIVTMLLNISCVIWWTITV